MMISHADSLELMMESIDLIERVEAPVTFIPQFAERDKLTMMLPDLLHKLSWVRFGPRSEYYVAKEKIPYTYGRGAGERTYYPQPFSDAIVAAWVYAEHFSKCSFEACFLNRYHDEKDHLGWHADDSLILDPTRPIAIISFGSERDILFRENANKENVHKLRLTHGSLCIMHPGMQQTWQHRIPKPGHAVRERVSLTFRGFSET